MPTSIIQVSHGVFGVYGVNSPGPSKIRLAFGVFSLTCDQGFFS